MSKIVILGAGGQLGRELSLLYPNAHRLYHSESSANHVDLSNPAELEKVLWDLDPDLIFNAVALANVDLCEREKELAYLINGESVKTIVNVARKSGALFVHVSTDYVFDGTSGNYKENAIPNPLNYYGLSKLIGDTFAQAYDNSIIVRTSGVFGYNKNFPLFVLETLKKGEPVSAIKGFYSPIHAKNLAEAIKSLSTSELRGLINVAGDKISRYDLAIMIAEKFNLDKSLISENKDVALLIANRPFDSSLDISKAKDQIDFDFYSIGSNMNAFKERQNWQLTGSG